MEIERPFWEQMCTTLSSAIEVLEDVYASKSQRKSSAAALDNHIDMYREDSDDEDENEGDEDDDDEDEGDGYSE